MEYVPSERRDHEEPDSFSPPYPGRPANEELKGMFTETQGDIGETAPLPPVYGGKRYVIGGPGSSTI